MSDMDDIHALDSGVADAINSGNAAAAAACYSEEAAIMPPGVPRMEGKKSVEAFWQGAIDAGLVDVKIAADTVDIHGDDAVTVGTLTGTMGGQGLTGKYIVVSRKTADGWKIHRDIWNFDA